MFGYCESLKVIPSHFTLGSGVLNCSSMFDYCGIETIPTTFTLPNGVLYANMMFYECDQLKYIPDTFVLPSSLLQVASMFYGCDNLERIPQGMTISENVKTFYSIFAMCPSLSGTLTINCPINTDIEYSHQNIFLNNTGDFVLTGNSPDLDKIKSRSGHRAMDKVTIT
jgi:hypothetical protein